MSTATPCWLVWAVSAQGTTDLRAICTTQARANYYRKSIHESADFDGTLRVWVELSRLDHLFGWGVLPQGEWFNDYGLTSKPLEGNDN